MATDRLHWLRAAFAAATADADRVRLARDLLRRSDESGDRAEAARWRRELAKLVRELAPPPRSGKP